MIPPCVGCKADDVKVSLDEVDDHSLPDNLKRKQTYKTFKDTKDTKIS